jgi:hypothetical protein
MRSCARFTARARIRVEAVLNTHHADRADGSEAGIPKLRRTRTTRTRSSAQTVLGANAVSDIFSGRSVARDKQNQGLIRANQTAGKAYHFRHESAIESKTPQPTHAKQIST